MPTQKLTLHPDRALPVDPEQRRIAREIYAETAALPLISMHGHVDAAVFADNQPFADPAQLLIVPDHYVCRMLYSQGFTPEQLGVPRVDGGATEGDSRTIWRRFASNWKLFRGTPSRYWLEHELVTVFSVEDEPSEETADAIYDQIAGVIASDDFRPQQLLDRFNIELISTTDPAQSDLSQQQKLAEQGLGERVLPTFRPDSVVYLDRDDFDASIATLGEVSGSDVASYQGYLKALRERRRAFVAMGAKATDHGHFTADTTPLPEATAAEIYERRLSGGQLSVDEVNAFAAHMLFQMAAMSCEDGLVMQIHPGVLRDHHSATYRAHGQDKGYDIPVAAEYTRGLRPLLDAFGTDPRFGCIVYTLDEDVYTRELAPMAGVYSSMRVGAPWWFIDSPEGMLRFFESATETAGFYNMSGFVDDTRAYCSIPARHDLYRRISAHYLSRLVGEHRLRQDEAVSVATDLAYHLPKLAFRV
ncbi:glucuronate isomerase [Nigerium massiliense]|uniref:glucuronate isomerase n=1 Tax=Nigerium massiliense TaxID=1522317 RepID=UPI00058CE6C6|nr:glucuronate isomerase [Nigerium massiliense]